MPNPDQNDPLKDFRKMFRIPEKDGREQIYFLGNSLGLQPVSAKAAIDDILDQWANLGVEGFFKGSAPWLDYHNKLTHLLSPIIGARPHEITVMNQLTVNLHLLMATFYRPSGKRKKIICEAKAFPSDQYMLASHIRFLGMNPDEVIVEVEPRPGEHHLHTADILEEIDRHRDELAMVFFGGVNYYTGQLFDMKTITAAARSAGAVTGFDLAHAAGNVSLALHEWNVDFACWCSYKYLNSGPGAVAGAYIHERHHRDSSLHKLAGWWGNKKETRFMMAKNFEPSPGAEGWQLSTPSLLLYATHYASLQIFDSAGMPALLKKGKQLTGYLEEILIHLQREHGAGILEIITPAEKGCQLSILFHQNGRQVFEELTRNGIFTDWREPGVIRVAPVPLYNRFEEIDRFGEVLKKFLHDQK